MISYIIWDVSPTIFDLGFLEIRWYGLMFAFSFYFGYLIGRNMFVREGIPVKALDNLTTWIIVATVIGARLGHTLFYEPGYYLRHPFEILKVWEGGLASHGAAIGIILALWWFARKQKWNLLWLLDKISIPVALSGFFIRMGNLFNSEIYGNPTAMPWGFIFKSVDDLPRHPTQLYEALSYLAIAALLYWLYRKENRNPRKGLLFGWLLVLIFGVRIIIEFFKEPQVMFEQNILLNMGQLLSIPLVIAGIVILLRSEKERK